MPFEVVSADRAEHLLKELYNFREKLIHDLSRPQSAGNLEEQTYDKAIAKLAEVQGCISATSEYLGKA